MSVEGVDSTHMRAHRCGALCSKPRCTYEFPGHNTLACVGVLINLSSHEKWTLTHHPHRKRSCSYSRCWDKRNRKIELQYCRSMKGPVQNKGLVPRLLSRSRKSALDIKTRTSQRTSQDCDFQYRETIRSQRSHSRPSSQIIGVRNYHCRLRWG